MDLEKNNPRPAIVYTPSGWENLHTQPPTEASVTLTVNGQDWLAFRCTPRQQEALALGFLFNEGVIASLDEVAVVDLCANGANVDVWLRKAAAPPEDWTRTSGCTGGRTAVKTNGWQPILAEPVSFSPQEICQLAGDLLGEQTLYRESGGLHATALAHREGILLTAEDLGRHNTLDKLAGLRLLNRDARPAPAALTTGRISSEMLQKAARMGVQILISRTSPTSLSLEMAETWGLTVIGYARRDRFRIYTHPERISGWYPASETPGAPVLTTESAEKSQQAFKTLRSPRVQR